MKNEKLEKELETTLKNSRLKILLSASEELVDRRYNKSLEYLLVFGDTVPNDSAAGQQLHDLYVEYESNYNQGISKMDHAISSTLYGGYEQNPQTDPLQGFGTEDYRDQETKRLLRIFVRGFHTTCWNLAHTYELIPSK